MDYIKISMEKLLDWLNQNLSEKRYLHSIGTAEYAENLARSLGLDEQKAYIAGLLHDCAKCFPDEKLLDIIKKHIPVEECELMSKKTLHAPVSAYVAKEIFGVEDDEILSSIRWHTLGKLNMTVFEKINFLADKVELKTRHLDCSAKIREKLKEENGLNKAMLECYKETIKSLVNRDLKICPVTITIYNNLEDTVNVN